MPDAVSDSSPLIRLAKIEVLELFSRLYSQVFIPPAVWQEVVEESDGRPGAVEMQRAVAAGWMVQRAAKNETLVIALRQTLDNGEAETIALATELHPESVLLPLAKATACPRWEEQPSRSSKELRTSVGRPSVVRKCELCRKQVVSS